MKIEKYQELLADEKVIKIGTIGGGFFKDRNNTIAIQFFFYHPGGFFQNNAISNSRITFSIFPLENLIEEIKPITIIDTILILANSDSLNYALTYRISVNEKERKVTAILLDKPEMGDRLISDDERTGIELSYA